MQLIRAVLKAFLICQIARVRRDKSHVPDAFQSEALEERERTGREPQHVAPAACVLPTRHQFTLIPTVL